MFHEPKNDTNDSNKTQVCSDGKVSGKGRPVISLKCLTPNCLGMFGGERGKSGARGLCKKCHADAMRLVKKKATTWEELEALGLAQPKYGSLIERALSEARKQIDESSKIS